jgi:hypothetical protein
LSFDEIAALADEVIDVTKAQSEEQATEQDTNLPQALFV